MKKLGIYSDAKKQIERHLAKLIAEHHFSIEEAGYEVLHVENQKVMLKIKPRLKVMVEHQFHQLYDNEQKKIEFSKTDDDHFIVCLQTGGDESYIFAIILESAIKKLNDEKKIRVNKGKELIQKAAKKYNAKKTSFKDPRIWYKDGVFHARFIINSMKVIISNSDPKVVAREISEKLPEFE